MTWYRKILHSWRAVAFCCHEPWGRWGFLLVPAVVLLLSGGGLAEESSIAKGAGELTVQATINETEWKSLCATASSRPQSEIRLSSFRPKNDLLKTSDFVCSRHGFVSFFDVDFISEVRTARAYFGKDSLVVVSWPGAANITNLEFYGSDPLTAAGWQDEMLAVFGSENTELKISAGDTTKDGSAISEKTAKPVAAPGSDSH